MTPDIINGSFELLGALFILNHCRALIVSKQAYGVSLLSTAFFSAWGCWNLFYYPHLDQTFSFVGGLALFGANCIWIALIIKYRVKQQ